MFQVALADRLATSYSSNSELMVFEDSIYQGCNIAALWDQRDYYTHKTFCDLAQEQAKQGLPYILGVMAIREGSELKLSYFDGCELRKNLQKNVHPISNEKYEGCFLFLINSIKSVVPNALLPLVDFNVFLTQGGEPLSENYFYTNLIYANDPNTEKKTRGIARYYLTVQLKKIKDELKRGEGEPQEHILALLNSAPRPLRAKMATLSAISDISNEQLRRLLGQLRIYWMSLSLKDDCLAAIVESSRWFETGKKQKYGVPQDLVYAKNYRSRATAILRQEELARDRRWQQRMEDARAAAAAAHHQIK